MKRYGITLENALTLVVSLKTSYFGSWLLTSSSFVDINLYFVTFVSTESPWTASLLPRRDGVPCCLGQCLRLWSPRVQPAAERPAGPAEAARPLALQLPSGAAALRRGIGYFTAIGHSILSGANMFFLAVWTDHGKKSTPDVLYSPWSHLGVLYIPWHKLGVLFFLWLQIIKSGSLSWYPAHLPRVK